MRLSRRGPFVALTATLMVLTMAWTASADGTHPRLQPAEVIEVVFPGGHVDVPKTVHIPELPPVLDVCLIVDLSGSYWDDLPNIKALAPGIWDALDAATDLQMGLASFVDFPFVPWGDEPAGDYAYRLDQQLTPTRADWLTAVDAMFTRYGRDGAESQYEALYQVATGAGNDVPPAGASLGDIAPDQHCAYRADATKVAILTTDAPFHNAGDAGPFPYPGASASDTEDALVDAGIVVIGLKAGFAGTELDDLATATGGAVRTTTSTSSDIADAILDALSAIEVDVSMLSDCAYPISTSFTLTSDQPMSGGHAVFTERISVDATAPGGTYRCKDWALINGQEMRDDTGAIIYEYKTIKVPEGLLTGGGQIGKGPRGSNFGGNVGYLADFTLVGQWQFQGTSGGEKVKLHSTSFTSLQFSNNWMPEPYPPDANANVADFTGMARVKVDNSAWVDGCTFRAQAQDHGEPGKGADIFGIRIDCTGVGGDVWTFGREFLDAGNLQIHSGLKS